MVRLNDPASLDPSDVQNKFHGTWTFAGFLILAAVLMMFFTHDFEKQRSKNGQIKVRWRSKIRANK